MSIEVLNESGLDLVDPRRTQQLAAFVLDRMRVHPQAELCITAVDEDTIAELNAKWMEKEGPTDVLAFPMDELRPGKVNEEPEEGVLGDLVLCPAVAIRQAEEAAAAGQTGHTALAELDLLTVHGILHLLGYDHAEPEEHQEMFALQARLLAQWQGEPGAGPDRAAAPR
jgi:probable rRNA maturation factor